MIKRLIFTGACFLVLQLNYGQLDMNKHVMEKANATGINTCEKTYNSTQKYPEFEYNNYCKAESYPQLTSNGLGLYFCSNQSREWLYYTSRADDKDAWGVPEPIKIDNFEDNIYSPSLIDGGKTLVFAKGYSNIFFMSEVDPTNPKHFFEPKEYTATSNDANISVEFLTSLSFTPDKNEMFGYNGENMVIFKHSSQFVYSATGFLNKELDKQMGKLSADGMQFLFVCEDVKNAIFCYQRGSAGELFNLENPLLLQEMEADCNIAQFSISDNASTLAMIQTGKNGTWNDNDLYIGKWTTEAAKPIDPSSFKTKKIIFSNNPSTITVITAPATIAVEPAPMQNITNSVNTTNATSDVKTPVAVEPAIGNQIVNSVGKTILSVKMGVPFPNPAANEIFFYYKVTNAEKKTENPLITITNADGKIVLKQEVTAMHGEAKVDIRKLSAGTYYVRLEYLDLKTPNTAIIVNR